MIGTLPRVYARSNPPRRGIYEQAGVKSTAERRRGFSGRGIRRRPHKPRDDACGDGKRTAKLLGWVREWSWQQGAIALAGEYPTACPRHQMTCTF
jgi:hypothetical protein